MSNKKRGRELDIPRQHRSKQTLQTAVADDMTTAENREIGTKGSLSAVAIGHHDVGMAFAAIDVRPKLVVEDVDAVAAAVTACSGRLFAVYSHDRSISAVLFRAVATLS